MSNIRVIWKSKSKEDKMGYLRLSSRVSGKTIIRNLPLSPIEEKHFNPKTQRLRSSFKEHEYYNNLIENKLKELSNNSNKITLLNDDKKSFLDFVDSIIDKNITNNIGTQQKYQNMRNLIFDFHSKRYGNTDIKFKDITTDYIEDFIKYLRVKGNKNNTIFYKIKSFKSFVNKGCKTYNYKYDKNPFDEINLKLEENGIEFLNKEDLIKLKDVELIEVYRSDRLFGQPIKDLSIIKTNKVYKNYIYLDDFRNFFLFQLFSQGIRVSDLMTLRWSDFEINDTQIRVDKKMVKVKEKINFLVNQFTSEILLKYIPYSLLPENIECSNLIYQKNYDESEIDENDTNVYITLKNEYVKYFQEVKSYKKEKKSIKKPSPFPTTPRYNSKIKEKGTTEIFISINDIQTKLNDRLNHLEKNIKTKEMVKRNEELIRLKNTDEEFKNLSKLLEIVRDEVNIKVEIEKTRIRMKNDKIYNQIKDIISFLKYDSNTRDMFVFPLLSNDDFKGVNNFRELTKHQYLKLQGRRTYYNRILKVIGQQCGIKKNLTSHLARHSYTSLMIEIGENLNLFDLMTSLGHKHLSTTQQYIGKFSSKRVDDLNEKLINFIK